MTSTQVNPIFKGANFRELAFAAAVGIGIWMIPTPEGLDPLAWQLLAIFVFTIVGIVAKALPMGAMAIVSMTLATITGTLSLREAIVGFSQPIIWLIVAAFFIARSFIKTGLGMRIAYRFIEVLGRKSLGLSYGLVFTDLVLAPVIPSNTARAGGIIFPIIESLAVSFGSTPEKGTQRRIGSFLLKTSYQCNAVTSAMFLTGMAANPLMTDIAGDMGIEITWGLWALAACVPGLISLLVIPYLSYKLYPPEIKETDHATALAREKLAEMGPISKHEWITMGIILLLIFMWTVGAFLKIIDSTTAALVGLSLMLISGVLTWEDIKSEKSAWDTLIWFSVLVVMATDLKELGFISWFTEVMKVQVTGIEWGFAFPLIVIIYFYSHYLFAGNAAHISSMYAAFLSVGLAVGAPPLLMALALAYCSSLFACLTHYGTGSAPIFFGAGYVDLWSWWKLGGIISVVNIAIWIGVGSVWWKFLGIW